MKKFHFTLETLLELRKRKEDAIKELLGKKHAEAARARIAMGEVSDGLKEMQATEKQAREASAGKQIDLTSMRASVNYRNTLKLDLIKRAQEIQEMEADAEYIRKRLVHATQARKALELLKEKRHGEWKTEYRRKEQVFLDEVSTQGFLRNRGNRSE